MIFCHEYHPNIELKIIRTIRAVQKQTEAIRISDFQLCHQISVAEEDNDTNFNDVVDGVK